MDAIDQSKTCIIKLPPRGQWLRWWPRAASWEDYDISLDKPYGVAVIRMWIWNFIPERRMVEWTVLNRKSPRSIRRL